MYCVIQYCLLPACSTTVSRLTSQQNQAPPTLQHVTHLFNLPTCNFFTRILQSGCAISGPCLHFWVLLQTEEITHHFLLSDFLFRNYWYANILIQGCWLSTTYYKYHVSFKNVPWSDMNIYKVNGLYSYNLASALHFLSRSCCRPYSFYTVLKASCSVRRSYISLLSQCQETCCKAAPCSPDFTPSALCSLGITRFWHPEDYAGH